jgi:hypothetical protein
MGWPVRVLKQSVTCVVRFCFAPLYPLVRHHFRGEFASLRREVAALRQELAVLRGSSLEMQTRLGQQLADEFVQLQASLEARHNGTRAA